MGVAGGVLRIAVARIAVVADEAHPRLERARGRSAARAAALGPADVEREPFGGPVPVAGRWARGRARCRRRGCWCPSSRAAVTRRLYVAQQPQRAGQDPGVDLLRPCGRPPSPTPAASRTRRGCSAWTTSPRLAGPVGTPPAQSPGPATSASPNSAIGSPCLDAQVQVVDAVRVAAQADHVPGAEAVADWTSTRSRWPYQNVSFAVRRVTP